MATVSTTLSLTPRRWIAPVAIGVGFCLAVITAWMLAPLWGVLDSAVIGDPRTDAVRGMWGFHHLSQGWLAPTELLNTTRVNFPAGAYAVVLPLATGLLLGPLGLAFGPIITWNLSIALVIWATGMAVAWLGRVLTDAWLPGLLAAAILLAQPMFHHAIADGTVEHVALWSVPLFLGATLLALREQSVRWAFSAGALSIVVAVDSPYNAVYALVIGLAVFPWSLRWIHGRERDIVFSLVTLAGFAAFGSWLVLALFAPTGVGEPSEYANRLQATNATDLRLWWHYMADGGSVRDPTRPPTIITTSVLLLTTAFGLFGGRRAWPWLGIGWLMIGLSFGISERMPSDLGLWLGGPAGALGDVILAFNTMAYDLPIIGGIRFPRRWLTPAAMALALGAAHGVAKLQWRKPVLTHALTLIVIGAVLQNGVATSHIRTDFPLHSLPDVAFADYIAQDDTDGAVLLLPHVRATRPDATRDDLPVFARLGRTLSSADDLYLQIRFNRAMVPYPNLQTLAPVEQDKNVRRVLRDWSDLSHPQTAGQGIPPSALDRGADFERKQGIKLLRQSGLRWIAIDLGAYNDEGLAELLRLLSVYIIDDRLFEEGDGVRVLTLR